MFRIGSVDCEEFWKLCKEAEVTTYPSYKVYPPFPAPVVTLDDSEKELDTDKLKKTAYKFVGNRVIDLTATNFETFRNDNPGKPKIVLFTDKKKTPIVFRALSTYFDKTLEFGMVKAEEESLKKKYNVKSFPSFVLLKNDEKPIKYDGETYSYAELFEFINIHSETFVFGGTKDQEVKSAASKPWLSQQVPYFSKESANDICLKKDGTLCVIYIVKDKSQSDSKVLDALASVQSQFMSKIERGITFNFIRLDATAEPDFAATFGEGNFPKLAILNPGKRKRYLLHDKDLTVDGIGETLNTILGGDARFKAIKNKVLPDLISSHEIYEN